MLKLRHLSLSLLTLALPLSSAFAVSMNGAGSSFIYPLASKWFSDYNKATGVQINYQSIGSGAGMRQLLAGTIDFGASDAPMTDEMMAKSSVPILHLPATIGAVAVVYNLPGVPTGIKVTPEILADIFLGKITKWNDPVIRDMNTMMPLPDANITIAHRSDGSGTTNIFTDYLTKVSPEWATKVGKGTAVNWPTGLGAKGNEAVAGLVKQVEGSIGYVELAYAIKNHLTYILVRNQSGKFPTPSLASTAAAAAGGLETMPADFRTSITNMPGANAYPICGFTWFLVFQKYPDAEKGKALVDFLNWSMDQGQKMGPALYYPEIPASLVQKIKAAIATIQVGDAAK